MTRRAARRSRGIPRIWLLPALLLTAILGLTAMNVFSRSLVLDLVAWWPVWVLLAIVVAIAGRRRIGRLRVAGIASILVTATLTAFIVGHLNGWSINPSTSRFLVGPPAAGLTDAELVASIDGRLRVRPGSDFLYEVDPLRGGGEIGVPSAIERSVEDSIAVTLEQPADPGFDTSPGWEVRLSTSPTWGLALAGDIEADLSGLSVEELDLAGRGNLSLGTAPGVSLVVVEGAFNFNLPPEAPARVVGSASVPETWSETSDGWMSPNGGNGWVISVPAGSSVSIVER
jgi:hypothetical protein